MNKKIILDEVFSISENIIKDKVIDNSGVSWNTYGMDEKNQTVFDKNEMIYIGNAGILLYFIELYKSTKDNTVLQLIKSEADWLVDFCNQKKDVPYSFYTGRLGSMYALIMTYKITENEKYLNSAIAFLNEKNWNNEIYNVSDILNGISGEILACILCHSLTGDERYLKVIDKLTGILLDKAYIGEQGIYWDRSYLTIKGLCGFSHGASGIGLVFLELGNYFKNDAFFWIAEQAFLYESMFLNKKRRNWPDFRMGIYEEKDYYLFKNEYEKGNIRFFSEKQYMSAWCHGNIGIGFARIRAAELLKRKVYLKELKVCLNAAYNLYKYRCIRSYNLCHGLGGNADLLLELYKLSGDIKYLQFSEDIAMSCVKSKQKRGYYISGMKNVADGSDHSLLLGNAGIAYFLLKTINPHKIPSILLPASKPNKHKLKLNGYKYINVSPDAVKRIILKKNFPISSEFLTKVTIPYRKKEHKKLNELNVKNIEKYFSGNHITDIFYRDIFKFEFAVMKSDVKLKSFTLLFLESSISSEFCEENHINGINQQFFKWGSGIKLINSKINIENPNYSVDIKRKAVFHYLVRYNDKGYRLDELNELSYNIIKCFKKRIKPGSVVKKIAGNYISDTEFHSKLVKIIDEQIWSFVKNGVLIPA